MSGLSYKEVRWLSIENVAHAWSKEKREPPSLIAQELQLAFINFERFKLGLGKIDVLPAEGGRPPLSTPLTREFIEEFCAKQNWPKPKFWFGRDQSEPTRPGRPTNMPAIVQELKEIAQRNELADTLIAQSTVLSEWARASYPNLPPTTPETIANNIGGPNGLFQQLKAEAI
jgi:hypothetical protein